VSSPTAFHFSHPSTIFQFIPSSFYKVGNKSVLTTVQSGNKTPWKILMHITSCAVLVFKTVGGTRIFVTLFTSLPVSAKSFGWASPLSRKLILTHVWTDKACVQQSGFYPRCRNSSNGKLCESNIAVVGPTMHRGIYIHIHTQTLLWHLNLFYLLVLLLLAYKVFLCFLKFSQKTPIISLRQINRILLVINMQCGLCQVGTELLYIKNKHLKIHGVYIRIMYIDSSGRRIKKMCL